MHSWLSDFFARRCFGGTAADILAAAVLAALAFVVSFGASWLAKMALIFLFRRVKLHRYERQTQILRGHAVFRKMAALAAPAVLLCLLPYVLPRECAGGAASAVLQKCIMLYFYCALWIFLAAAMSAFYDIVAMRSRKSIRGFEQITQLLVALVIAILAAAMLFDKSPFRLLAGLGASAAVVMLVFKDTLLGFVASVQLSVNNMLQTGDWITMEKYGADGVVIEIGLTAVKVRNWDNTITNVPTYALVSDSYRNWRGMSESGGRRVMRHVLIDISRIKFCGADLLARMSKMPAAREIVADLLARGKSAEELTNIGIFRAYLERYLASRPEVNLSMTHFVRQLQPTEKGLPLELYFFTSTDWLAYENIQADIFDHVIASAALFDLRLFQDESDAA